MLTTKDRVEQYLKARPGQPFCDYCLMVAVQARERQIVQKATSDLARKRPLDFSRHKVLCTESGQPSHIAKPKLCITYTGAGPTGGFVSRYKT